MSHKISINFIKSTALHLFSIVQSVRRRDRWREIDACDVLLVSHDANCGYTYNGKAYSHLLDSLGDLCAARGLVVRSVAAPYSRLTGASTYYFSVSYNRFALAVALLGRLLRLFRGREKAAEWACERRKNLWCQILGKAKPRWVIGIQPGADLCRAGKNKKIPVFDLQHGVINDDHLWYGAQYRKDTPTGDLPDGFLCWDEASAEALRKWALQKGIAVTVVGNLWFLRFLFPNPNDVLAKELSASPKIFNNGRPSILVSLQWGMAYYYEYPGFNGVMVDALEKVILQTADSYNWLLRLHPVQFRGAEKKMSNSYLLKAFGHLQFVEWSSCSELPLPVVLKQSDLHITDMSSIVIEAAWLGIHSALLNINISPGGSLENIYAFERGLGMAEVLPQDAEVIMQWIANTLSKGKGACLLKDTGRELHSFIDQIVSSGGRDVIYS